MEKKYLVPRINSSKRDLKVKEEFQTTFKKDRGELYVSPNADLLVILSDFLNLELVEERDRAYFRPYFNPSKEEVPPSLFGLLRAFYLLLVLDPSLFKKLKRLAREMSFLHDDEYSLPFAVAYEGAEEKKDLYLTALSLLKRKVSAKNPSILKIGIFSKDTEKEKEEMSKFLSSLYSTYRVKPHSFSGREETFYDYLERLSKILSPEGERG